MALQGVSRVIYVLFWRSGVRPNFRSLGLQLPGDGPLLIICDRVIDCLKYVATLESPRPRDCVSHGVHTIRCSLLGCRDYAAVASLVYRTR